MNENINEKASSAKKLFTISAVMFITAISYGQDVKKRSRSWKNQMDVFASKTASFAKV